MADDEIPLNRDKTPIPDDADHAEVSFDIADLGLPSEYEDLLRGKSA